MKKLLFTKLYLLSLKEKKAKIVNFHPQMTIIKGNNSTGKSCLVKMIYHTMGAAVPNIPKRFKEAEVISLLFFKVDSTEYSILKNHDQFTLFCGTDKILQTTHVTEDLAPVFSEMFNFKLQLNNRQSEASQATPAFLFLPFYLDQDQGWHKVFESFEKLGQFSDWKNDFLRFHLGVCPSEYYVEKSKKSKNQIDLEDCLKRRDVVKRTQNNISQRLAETAVFDINLDDYKSAVTKLIAEANNLKQQEEVYLSRRLELNDEYRTLNAQKIILEQARKEIQKDFSYSVQKLPDKVECPICHTEHDNSFAVRFNLAVDEYRCTEILQEIEIRLIEIERELEQLNDEIVAAKAEITKINQYLQYSKHGVSLEEIINISGRKQINNILDEELKAINSERIDLEDKITACDQELKKFINQDLQKKIYNDFSDQIKSNYRELDLLKLALEHNGIRCKTPHESGSDKTRMIYAYFLAFISIIFKRSSACFCPIVIDSPRQNDVDQKHWELMLKLLKNELPTDSQCILSLVEHTGIEFGGDEIVLDNSYHLLNEEDFQEAYSAIIPVINGKNEQVQPEFSF